MCATCGCSEHVVGEMHPHPHAHPHSHPHGSEGEGGPDPRTPMPEGGGNRTPRRLQLELDLLAKNNAIAERNRAWLRGRETVALNLMSAPGSGKTTLLEQTIVLIPTVLP